MSCFPRIVVFEDCNLWEIVLLMAGYNSKSGFGFCISLHTLATHFNLEKSFHDMQAVIFVTLTWRMLLEFFISPWVLNLIKVLKIQYLCEICRWWCILWWRRCTWLAYTCFLSSQVKISTMPIMQFEVNLLHLNSIDKSPTVPIVYFEVNCKYHFNQVFDRKLQLPISIST